MAYQFASEDARLTRCWEVEKSAASQREKEHWEEVLRKQGLARQLRSEIKSREDEKLTLLRKIEENWNSSNEVLRQLRRRCDEVSNRLSALASELNSAEKPPPPVIQPLPSEEKKALKVLFFMHMPQRFRSLSRLSFTCQQMLIPRSDSYFKATEG
jgi:hypothetical protein